jgi:hypothetical protein
MINYVIVKKMRGDKRRTINLRKQQNAGNRLARH